MNAPLESISRLRLQALGILALVFVIGALTGAVIERSRTVHLRPAPRGGLPPELVEELRLTTEQQERIDRLLREGRRRTDAVRERFIPELQALTDSLRAEIRACLDPEQQRRFDRMEPPFPLPPPRGGPGGAGGPGGPGPGGPGPGGPGHGERPPGGGPPGGGPPPEPR